MSDPFIGQVKQLGFNWAPRSYAKCDGVEIKITDNTALYSLLGSQFGGNDRTYFKLPDLRGRVPMGLNDADQGTMLGYENVTLNENTMARHTHTFQGTSTQGTMPLAASTGEYVFADAVYSLGGAAPIYGIADNLVTMNPATCSTFGGGQSHTNSQPSLVINFVIALSGTYPQRS